MATKTKTPAEQRAALIRQVEELDLARVRDVLAIFQRDEVQQAIADLKALADPSDTTATQRSAFADANALVANMLLPLEGGLEVATRLEQQLDARLNPPAPPPTPAAPVPATPPTE